MTQSLVDSHAHLDDSAFDADRAAVIGRARDAGLRYVLAISGGSGADDLASAVPLAERHDWIYAGVGIHPHEARHAEENHFDLLRAAGRHPKVLGLGEIGLDYHYDHSPREIQQHVLIRQLAIARELKRPIIIHCREAWADLREIVATHWKDSRLGGILHCFSGSTQDAAMFLEWGFLVSFAGNLTYKKAEDLRGVAREVPLERLLTETDSPYLAPVPHRGKRNEPAYLREVTRALAVLRNLSEEEMGQQVLENFRRFFALL
jgi:TatD DNase family protein